MFGVPPAGTVIGDHKLEIDPIVQFGYLTLTTNAKSLTITFQTAIRGAKVTPVDFVTLDLVAGKITASGSGAPPKPGHKPPKPPKPPKPGPKPKPKPTPVSPKKGR
jgi:hypothetical protein